MRHVTAVVPLYHKQQQPNMHVVEARTPAAYNHSAFILENSLRNDIQLLRPNLSNLQLGIPRNCLEEIPLIHEISKKYILIPRIKPTLTNDYLKDMNLNINESTDWKSKYDILEQLKKNEKEEQVDNYKVESPPEKQFSESILNKKPTSNRELDDDFHLNKYQTDSDKLILDYRNDLPEKDLSDRKLYCYSEDTKKYRENEKENLTIPESRNKSAILTVNEELNKTIQNKPQDYEDIQKTNNFQGIIGDTNLENPEIEIVENVENQCSTEIEPTIYKELHAEEEKCNTEDSEKVVLQDVGELSSVQIINPKIYPNPISISPKNLESPIKIGNSQASTPKDDVTLDDGVNINLEGHLVNEGNLDLSNQYESQTTTAADHINNPADTAGLKELADEKGMFYSENTEANCANNQDSVEQPYNTEYPQESENYQQNEEYAYYESTQPAQTYPLEINEHKESFEHYNQTYEQRCTNLVQEDNVQQQEGYEQQPQHELDSTAFESSDQPEQHLDQNYDSNGPVEQQLDHSQYEQQNYDSNGLVDQQLDRSQYEQQNYDSNGLVEQQLDRSQYEQQNYDSNGLVEQQFDHSQYEQQNYDSNGLVEPQLDQSQYEQQNYDSNGLVEQPLDQSQYEQQNYDSNGIVEQQLDQSQYEQLNYDSNGPVEQQLDNEQDFVQGETNEQEESLMQDNPQAEQVKETF